MLRKFKEDTKQERLYYDMYKNQTYDYVINKNKKYSILNNAKLSINEILNIMDKFVDPSDPDLDKSNSIHAYQTAERIREKYPYDYDLQIIGLIHDLGKILFIFGEPPWAIVGDTFVLGCRIPKSVVYYNSLKYIIYQHPDYNNSILGVYKEKCGLDKLLLSFGHDEYLYQVLKQNKTHKIKEKYMNIIRYHSFYPWHTMGEYRQFMNKSDYKKLENVLMFNQFDLYSKNDKEFKLTDEIKKYYNDLLNLYFPKELQW